MSSGWSTTAAPRLPFPYQHRRVRPKATLHPRPMTVSSKRNALVKEAHGDRLRSRVLPDEQEPMTSGTVHFGADELAPDLNAHE
ncbi:hypothetical protein HYPDE_26978 [Hyphomicrobium denitrificans 1NES1]|uniref:Uncharacterized protein n=2 Tax=Hyphomicrobium denitrificans TaxID=53399 RepID=N0B979_9HYPH|nr:hypothetical protein HYPDE_26978 [Hyphomicrobium denitrificans 1NES1]